MEHCTEDGRLPQTFAAFDRGEVVGAYQFTLSDMFVRPDIYPWLANVYVPPEHRGKGYSRVMLESVRENAAKLPGVDEIFLFTPHTGLYEKYGWEYMEDAELYNGDKPNRMYRLRLK